MAKKKYAKWIAGGLGWAFGGPIGGILGFVLGNLYDNQEDIKDFQQSTQQRYGTRSGDFEVSLLILSAQVIKADGKVDPKELEYVRKHFRNMFGEARAERSFKVFKKVVNSSDVSTRQICLQIRSNMEHPSRLQLLHFLFGVAGADGLVSESEVEKIHTMARYLGISEPDYISIRSMFYNDIASDYKVLEIERTSTDDQVKKAYRKMAMKYHPDKVQHLGEEVQKGAEEKFKRVQKAYENIKKERGL